MIQPVQTSSCSSLSKGFSIPLLNENLQGILTLQNASRIYNTCHSERLSMFAPFCFLVQGEVAKHNGKHELSSRSHSESCHPRLKILCMQPCFFLPKSACHSFSSTAASFFILVIVSFLLFGHSWDCVWLWFWSFLEWIHSMLLIELGFLV